jgi:hypothetical protein
MKRVQIKLTILVALLLLTARAASAESVIIEWNANTEANLAGYFIHVGEQSGAYKHKLDVGNVTGATITNLLPGKTYYFVVQAHSTDGLQSPLSAEVHATIPSATAPPQPPASFLTMPGSDGRLTTRVLKWTPVSDAVAYALHVGTTSGGKDVVDTGPITATSYQLGNLDVNQLYFARIWTKQGAAWQFSEMNFMMPAQPSAAKMISPVAGEKNVTSAQPFLWTETPGAQAYRLVVGTQQGSTDVADSGPIKTTSYVAPSLPAGRRLYARIYTKLQGNWYHDETYFNSANSALLLYPRAGAGDVSENELFHWTAVTDAQAYYLKVGTSPDSKDVVDSGATLATSYSVTGLSPGQSYYAQLWTKLAKGWVADKLRFRTSLTARLLRPVDDGSDLGQGLAWTSIKGAQAYALHLGNARGGKELLNTGETLDLEHPTPPLPAAQEIYSRVFTKLSGVWRARDASFNLNGAGLIQPGENAIASHVSQLFTWTHISNAEGYALHVGSMPGAKDVVDSGPLTSTSIKVTGLPRHRTLFVTLWTLTTGGGWRHTQTVFITK